MLHVCCACALPLIATKIANTRTISIRFISMMLKKQETRLPSEPNSRHDDYQPPERNHFIPGDDDFIPYLRKTLQISRRPRCSR